MTDERAIEQLLERARVHADAKRNGLAIETYLELLRKAPMHADGLIGFSNVLRTANLKSGALSVLRELAESYPHDANAHYLYASLLVDMRIDVAAKKHFDEALSIDAGHFLARRGLVAWLYRHGEDEEARLQSHLITSVRDNVHYTGQDEPIHLLVLWAARGGNVPIEDYFDTKIFDRVSIAVEMWNSDEPLPPHDLVFNIIGDADQSSASLRKAREILEQTKAPVFNPPDRILGTGRAQNRLHYEAVQGLKHAHTELWPKGKVTEAALELAGFTYPVLLRSPGRHTGQDFEKVDSADGLTRALEKLPGGRGPTGNDLFVMQFIDTRSADGKYRKYRVLFIDGELYPLHLAVSNHWKVHYFSAEMQNSTDHRKEDEAFLNDPEKMIGQEAWRTLRALQREMRLDYGGVDFGLDVQGGVVVFESNATMLLPAVSDDPVWAYRKSATNRAADAIRSMLLRSSP